LRKEKQVKPLPINTKTVGDWIQMGRREKNLAPSHVAAKMGIAAALVQAWENGIYQPSEQQKEVLHTVLDGKER